jgi:hypothetical protein
MKKFILQSVLFCMIPAIIFVVSIIINTIMYDPYIIDAQVDTLILGDSHAQVAIDDSMHPRIQNMAVSSEGYIYTYAKLKELLKHNPHIKHIVLGFSYHNLSDYYDEYITGENAGQVVQKYIDVLDRETIQSLFKKNKTFLVLPAFKNALRARNNTPTYLGGFHTYKVQLAFVPEVMHGRIKNQYYEKKRIRGYSAINIKYLAKINELCRESEVQLSLLRTPLHNQYVEEVPELFKEIYSELIKQNGLQVIDFDELQLKDHHFFRDGEHLGREGASFTTKHFLDRCVK